tara:strand:- start:84 stop:431 length:348 start_codon:yes stop_codon:yes gene_type:complete
MKKLLGIVVLGLLWCNLVNASKTLVYSQYKNDPNNKSYIEHLKSVETGISWMNIEVKSKVYCQPDNLEVNLGNITNAVNLGVKKLQTMNYTSEEIDELPVEFIMVKGFGILFPCK